VKLKYVVLPIGAYNIVGLEYSAKINDSTVLILFREKLIGDKVQNLRIHLNSIA
jgi:hypothetical protein